MTKHTARLTTAANVTLPSAGMFLVKVKVIGAATPGAFSIRYDGIARAYFPAPTNGLGEYDVSWGPLPSVLQSGLFALSAAGVPAAIELTFSTNKGNGTPISAFRSIEFRRTDAGATSADISVDYDVGPSVPRWIVGYISTSAGRFRFPSVGGYIQDVEASAEEFEADMVPAQDIKEKSNALTLTVITDAASTIAGYVYY